jgi:hypothetical protein
VCGCIRRWGGSVRVHQEGDANALIDQPAAGHLHILSYQSLGLPVCYVYVRPRYRPYTAHSQDTRMQWVGLASCARRIRCWAPHAAAAAAGSTLQ